MSGAYDQCITAATEGACDAIMCVGRHMIG